MVNQAIILAAGLGSRLEPLTLELPKPLIKVNNIPILHNSIENLVELGVKKVILVVGYKSKVIKEYIMEHFPELDVEFINNDKYRDTNNMFSLFLALNSAYTTNSLILEGDVFFESDILGLLKNQKNNDSCWFADSTLIDVNGCYLKKQGSRVSDIEIYQNKAEINLTEQVYKSIGILYLNKTDLIKVKKMLELEVEKKQFNLYYDLIIAKYLNELELTLIDVKGYKWFEIDDRSDLAKAEEIFFETGFDNNRWSK